NGVANALYTANAAGTKRVAVHHEGIELDAAITRKKAAAAGVKGFVIFHGDDSGFHGIQRAAATFQNVPALVQRALHAGQVSLNHVIGNCPGAAVDDEYRKLSQGIWSLYVVAALNIAEAANGNSNWQPARIF